MKKLVVVLIAITVFLGIAGAAHAVLYTYNYDARHTLMRAWNNDSVTWRHNLGFDPQNVTLATLELSLADDGDWWSWEFARLDIDTKRYFWEVDSGNISFNVTSLVSSLSNRSIFEATLTAKWWGDFYFDGATLSVEATGVSASPEPSTIMLMGAGILGLAAYGRRRYKAR